MTGSGGPPATHRSVGSKSGEAVIRCQLHLLEPHTERGELGLGDWGEGRGLGQEGQQGGEQGEHRLWGVVAGGGHPGVRWVRV